MKNNFLRSWFISGFILSASISAEARQLSGSERFREISIIPAESPVTIDGKLDEQEWSRATIISNFVQYWPDDGGLPGAETEVRLLYDDKFLYIAVTCFGIDNDPVIQSLRRNIADEFFRSDAVGIVLDPLNERNSGYFFGINAGNAQIDGTLNVTDNTTLLDTNWDTRWYSATLVEDSVLYIEAAIPFSSLQFRERSSQWRLNIFRNDMQRFEFSSWANMPLPLPLYDLRYTGELTWTIPLGGRSANTAILPYAAGDALKDYENGNPVYTEMRIGGDIRFPVSSSLNLDVTLNPDFSTIEVDEHIINLTRFDITLPEKRPFFLENSDIFTNFGREDHRPFISRSIGLHQGQQIPIHYGVKFSGNASSGFRFGAMNVQTGDHDIAGSQNYSVVALQQQVLSRSQVRGLFINRQSENLFSEENNFNRLGGLEFTYTSANGGLSAKAMYHLSFTEDRMDMNSFYGTDINFSSRHWNGGLHFLRVGRNYISDVGFIPRQTHFDAASDTVARRGFTTGAFYMTHRIIPGNAGFIAYHEPGIYSDHQYNEDGRLSDRVSGIWYAFETLASHKLHTYFDYFEVHLPFDTRLLGDQFDPLHTGFYSYYRTGFTFESDTRRNLSGVIGMETGSFYNGSRFTVDAELSFRASPRMRLGTAYTLNRVVFPDNHGKATLYLIGPRLYLSFSNNLFWTTFVQYNSQTDNLNINSRFQWRFLPMSDFFIVYNENSDTVDRLTPSNRGLTFKLTYWFNM